MNVGLLMAGNYSPPSSVTGSLDTVLGYIAWLVTAAGVAGLIIIGTRMAIAVKSGDAEEHMKEFLIVMGACVIASCAGPLVQFVGLNFWNTTG